MKNLLWFMACSDNSVNQTVSSSTGFNMLVRDDVMVGKDTIGYLPTKYAPATQLLKVHQVLKQVLMMMKALDPNKVVVFDQTIAAEINQKHEQYEKIVLQLGAFQPIIAIGKRFGSSGLHD